MDKAELIRHEIEKRRAHNLAIGNPLFAAMAEEDIELLSFINSLPEESVSKDLGEIVLEGTNFNKSWYAHPELAFKAGAEWQKENLWKSADGDDLPIFDREVIVLIKYNTQHNIHDKEYSTYKVGFGHRPNPDGWDGKNIDTNEVTHYTPKLYDKGGWNAPDIAYWLDVKLPKEIEL